MEDKCGWAQDTPEVRHQGPLRVRFSWWETFCHLFRSLGGRWDTGVGKDSLGLRVSSTPAREEKTLSDWASYIAPCDTQTSL